MHRHPVGAVNISHFHRHVEGRQLGHAKLTIISTASIKVGTFMAGHSNGSQGISSAAFTRNVTLFSWEAVLRDCFLVYIKLHAIPCTFIALGCSNIIVAFLPKTGTEIHCEFRCFIHIFMFEMFTSNFRLNESRVIFRSLISLGTSVKQISMNCITMPYCYS